MAVTNAAPDTTSVARLLDADPDNLRLFVDSHPNPSVGVVTTAAVSGCSPGDIDPETRATVAEWIAHQRQQWPGPRREVLAYLDRHGPTPQRELVDSATDDWSARIVRPTVARLERAGVIERLDDDSGRPRLYDRVE